MSDLGGRTVLVVGAGGGIGSAIVTSCREAGARLLHAELPGVAVATVGDEPVCRVDLAEPRGARPSPRIGQRRAWPKRGGATQSRISNGTTAIFEATP